jgi:hypothetical protein
MRQKITRLLFCTAVMLSVVNATHDKGWSLFEDFALATLMLFGATAKRD